MNEPEYRIENGRKIYEMTTTIGCVARPTREEARTAATDRPTTGSKHQIGRAVPDDLHTP